VAGAAAHDEGGRRLREAKEPSEIEIAAIEDVHGARFDRNQVQAMHIVQEGVGDAHQRGNRSAQVQERVQLDAAFAGSIRGPREETQTELDHRRVEGKDRLLER